MGYTRHKAMVITTWDDNVDKVVAAIDRCGLNDLMIGPLRGRRNGYHTLCVIPDGSKEGWDESDRCDEQIDALIDWLERQRYEDGSTPFDWAIVSYGSEDRSAAIDDHAWVRLGGRNEDK